MKWIIAGVGGIAMLLGALWLVQGLGILTVPPIFCVAACETVEGFNPSWAVAGAALLLAGTAAVYMTVLRGRSTH